MSQTELKLLVISQLDKELNIKAVEVAEHYGRPKNFTRHLYMHYTCPSCHHLWSSNKGTCEIKFTVNAPILKFALRIYKQACNKCEVYGNYTIQTNQREWIVQTFVDLVAKIIQGIPKEKKEVTKHIGLAKGPHRSDLCEACKLGKCSEKGNDELTDLMKKLSLF